MIEWLEQSSFAFINHFVDSNKRLFWLYGVSSVLLVFLLAFKGQRVIDKFNHMFNRKIWLHRSARLDYQVWLINIVLKLIIITPLLFSAAPVAIKLNFLLEDIFGEFYYQTVVSDYALILFTLSLFLLDDFSRFLLHWLSHRSALLWRFHQVHHSAEVLTPVTVYRIHPVESALYACRLVLVQAIAIGVGFYFFGTKLQIQDVLGANLFVFLFNLFGANLRHSHIWIGWGKLEKLFISPAQHQIHHSRHPEHYNRNYGSALAIWDKLFGSLLLSGATQRPKRFGLNNNPLTSISKIYLYPLIPKLPFTNTRNSLNKKSQCHK